MKYADINNLYKYRGFNEHSLQSLITETAWFSKPSSFNDPFDCGIHIDEGKMEESVRKAVQEAYLKAGRYKEDIPKSEFKVRNEDKRAFSEFRQSVHDLVQSVGIFSLSAVNDDILMWAHYADSHRGFCIEYSRAPNNILGKQAEPVMYQEDLPSLSAQDITAVEQGFDKLWLTKSVHWKYEKEWRVINDGGGKAFQFPCEIKSVIFGLKMNESNRYTIRRILESRGVAFKETIRHADRFALQIADVKA